MMRNYMNLFFVAVATILLAASCDTTPETSQNVNPENAQLTRTVASEAKAIQVEFEGKTITLNTEDIVGTAQAMNAADADAAKLAAVNNSLMAAEKEAQALDVTFTMSEEPVENGMFIFGIQSENEKDLTIEMLDEEGFAMVANNQFKVTEGNNYKALNVQSLDNGSYNFRLKDDQGKELNRKVMIAGQE
jgi:hypothetical protein